MCEKCAGPIRRSQSGADEGHVQRMNAAGGAQNRRLDVMRRHGLDPGEKRPLVWVRPQRAVHKDAAAALARVLLPRQGDQVAEASFGHRVLVGS